LLASPLRLARFAVASATLLPFLHPMLLTTIALTLAFGGSPAPDTTALTQQQEVLGVVQRFFDAMKSKDTAQFRQIFEPGARLVGMRTRPGGEEIVQVLTWQRFGEIMVSDTRGTWIERAWEPKVEVRGSLAQVWAMYDFHFGTRFSHCGVDSVQLLRTADGWRIVSIADTYETTGCPQRPAPAP
jgi:hypothetical protein